MSASLDRAREKCEAALVRLEPLFTSDCKLTLVMRSTTNKDAFFVLSGDDLGAIEELLARARGVVARGPGEWRNKDLAAAVSDDHRPRLILAASRGVLSGLASDESLADAARSYRIEPRTLEGDAFETAFVWARRIKDDGERALGLPYVTAAIKKAIEEEREACASLCVARAEASAERRRASESQPPTELTNFFERSERSRENEARHCEWAIRARGEA